MRRARGITTKASLVKRGGGGKVAIAALLGSERDVAVSRPQHFGF